MKDTLSKQLPLLNAALKREKIDAVDPKAKPRRRAAGRSHSPRHDRRARVEMIRLIGCASPEDSS